MTLLVEATEGARPARFLYKRNPQSAAWRRKWSQSPVLLWARLAYDACLNAGSTAGARALPPIQFGAPPELHGADLRTERAHRWKYFGGRDIGVSNRLRSGDLLLEGQACWLDYTTGTEMVRASGNAPEPGTDLVRCGV